VSVLLVFKADVNAKDNDGDAPLHAASGNGHEDVVKELLDNHANVDLRDNDGWTPLHYAAGKGATKVMALLLAAGATVNAKDKDGWTPLRVAAEALNREPTQTAYGQEMAMTLLRQHGAVE
jgi:ankyrin repeat protein